MRKQIQGLALWAPLMRLGEKTGCHQMPQRSFFLHGYQFPLCARCTGVLLGECIAELLCFFLPPSPLALLCLLPLAWDGGTQWLGWRVSCNWLRFATGLLAGYGNISFLLWCVQRLLMWLFP